MQQWKQEICERISMPKLNEGLFNKAWDSLSPEAQQELLNQENYYVPDNFRRAVFDASGFTPRDFEPKKVEDWKHCAAQMEFGNKDYIALVTPAMARIYRDGKDAPKPAAERAEQIAALRKRLNGYRPQVVHMVLYGYDPNDYVSEDLAGPVPKDVFEAMHAVDLLYQDYWLSHAIMRFRGEFEYLSNFYPAQVELDGVTYPTVENAFQAAKTLNPEERIPFVTCSPAEAKKMGRALNLRKDWEDVKEDVMRALLLQKFAVGSENLEKLCATYPAPIIEGNDWHDTYWGKCQCPKCHGGENRLGDILEWIRRMDLAQRAVEEGKKDRFALILGIEWEAVLNDNPDLVDRIMKIYHATGILIEHNSSAILYHATNDKNADLIVKEGFKVSGDETEHTYGGDVVYAYQDKSVFDGDPTILEVHVSHWWRAAYTEDKDDKFQHECIFLPKDVVQIKKV